ncbi:hypothetical protein ACKVV1_001799 [Pyricularia oryzae]|nr:hypothetical protein MCOR08_004614 [Pyricularia oryzae]
MMLYSLVLLGLAAIVRAEDGSAAWLRYAPLDDAAAARFKAPEAIVALNSTQTSPVFTAGQELQKGFNGMLGKNVNLVSSPEDLDPEDKDSRIIVVGTAAQFTDETTLGNLTFSPGDLEEDGFYMSTRGRVVQIVGQNERGALYGAFEYLARIARHEFCGKDGIDNPHQPIRWVNQWDNLDDTGTHGSVERGYAGPSIFFANGGVVADMTRAAEYARLLASIRINAVVVNNVNSNPQILSPGNIDGLGRIADAFRPYGVQLGLSLNFASPQTYGGLDTFDPLDERVIKWWEDKTDELYARIPDMAGYLIKANSEGQPGPHSYNRTLAEGANLFAKATKHHGGLVMFRAFVYDHLADWTNPKLDRAKAAVDYFEGLDEEWDDNVIVQIKYGPIDFQVREPPSPLFAHLPTTDTVIELQVTQEYLGQQNHLVYMAPLWKEILDFDLHIEGQEKSLVRDVVAGERPGGKKLRLSGSAAVVNVGTDANWLGSHLAMSNLYAYGVLAWDPMADSEAMLRDWIKLTFGHDQLVADTIVKMSMESWPAYEDYSGNLGIQTLADILHTHFGPGPQSQDGNGWGQWTRANATSVGMDRTVATGTGFSGQYPPEVAQRFEKIETTPDNLILWFHHVPWTHVLKSGKTVIQHFYDAHYDGSALVQEFPLQWRALQGHMDDERFEHMLFRLNFQAGHALVWRDSICNFYNNMTSIPDEKGRVGNHPYRIEAENMEMEGYRVYNVDPFHTASARRAVITTSNTTTGANSTDPGTVWATLDFEDGTYDVAVNYYDVMRGQADYVLTIDNKVIGRWRGDNEDRLGNTGTLNLDGHSATRIRFENIDIKKGNVLRIVGTPDGIEGAPLDYVAILPDGIVD